MKIINIDDKPLEDLYWQNKEDVLFTFSSFSKILHLLVKGFYKFWLKIKFNNTFELILVPKSKLGFFKSIEIYNLYKENNLKMEDLVKFSENNNLFFINNSESLISYIKRSRFNNNIRNIYILVWENKQYDHFLLNTMVKESDVYALMQFIYMIDEEIPQDYFKLALSPLKEILTFEDYSSSVSYKLSDNIKDLYYNWIKEVCEKKVWLYPQEYRIRLESELKTLFELKNYAVYIYNLYKIIKTGEQNNIFFWPWKWSSVWSLVLFLLWINKIDPVKNWLGFERFLNKNKKADIDIDVAGFDKERLEEIIQKLFPNKVARIFNDVNLSSLHPSWYIITDCVSDIKKVLPLSERHWIKAIEWTESNKEPLLSLIGYLKYDLLNSSFLNTVKEFCTINKINEQDFYNLDLSWQKEYTNLIEEKSIEIFQMWGEHSQKILKYFKIESFEELKIFNAINRPAIYAQGINFILKVLNQKKYIIYNNEKIDNVLHKTYWLILFQDQAIEVANTFSTIPYDLLIKTYKWWDNAEIIAWYEKVFIDNCMLNWIEDKKARYLWKWIISFQDYWLNESHAYSYAYMIFISIYILYLRTYKNYL